MGHDDYGDVRIWSYVMMIMMIYYDDYEDDHDNANHGVDDKGDGNLKSVCSSMTKIVAIKWPRVASSTSSSKSSTLYAA